MENVYLFIFGKNSFILGLMPATCSKKLWDERNKRSGKMKNAKVKKKKLTKNHLFGAFHRRTPFASTCTS